MLRIKSVNFLKYWKREYIILTSLAIPFLIFVFQMSCSDTYLLSKLGRQKIILSPEDYDYKTITTGQKTFVNEFPLAPELSEVDTFWNWLLTGHHYVDVLLIFIATCTEIILAWALRCFSGESLSGVQNNIKGWCKCHQMFICLLFTFIMLTIAIFCAIWGLRPCIAAPLLFVGFIIGALLIWHKKGSTNEDDIPGLKTGRARAIVACYSYFIVLLSVCLLLISSYTKLFLTWEPQRKATFLKAFDHMVPPALFRVLIGGCRELQEYRFQTLVSESLWANVVTEIHDKPTDIDLDIGIAKILTSPLGKYEPPAFLSLQYLNAPNGGQNLYAWVKHWQETNISIEKMESLKKAASLKDIRREQLAIIASINQTRIRLQMKYRIPDLRPYTDNPSFREIFRKEFFAALKERGVITQQSDIMENAMYRTYEMAFDKFKSAMER